MKELNGFEGEFCGVSLSHAYQASPIFGWGDKCCMTTIEVKSITMPFFTASLEIHDATFFDISPNKKYKITIQEVK